MLPKDPFILLSYINTKLRDDYENLDELCMRMDVNRSEIENKLEKAGFSYDKVLNQFK